MKNVISSIISLFLIGFLFWQCGSDTTSTETTEKEAIVEQKPKAEVKPLAVETKTAKKEAPLELKVPAIETAKKEESPVEQKAVKKEKAKAVVKKAATPKKKKSPAPKSRHRPKISFKETSYEFGLINQGDEIQHKFEFKNTGDKDLLISNVTATCGCTQPSYPFVPIPPGETGFIGVVYNSKGKLGTQKP
ncbi:MAG TPA: DUF1573 domain-containing protein, partial [Saprospiraceae bacterium]|nr:DUF1573 domain-containing protein [Saprospiraceae bacterium]